MTDCAARGTHLKLVGLPRLRQTKCYRLRVRELMQFMLLTQQTPFPFILHLLVLLIFPHSKLTFPIRTPNLYLVHSPIFHFSLHFPSPFPSHFIPHSTRLPDGVLFCQCDPLMPSNRAGNILKGFG